MKIEFENYPEVSAGVSERSDGSMVWWNRLPVPEDIAENRNKYFQSLGIDPTRVVAGGGYHGTEPVIVGESEAGKYLLSSDSLITNIPNLFLTVTVADCVPVFFYNPKIKTIAMTHSGWKGLVGGVLENTVESLCHLYDSEPEDLLVAIGPHIKVCHYEVGPEVAEKFAKENIEQRDGKIYANLTKEAEMRLRKIGVENIVVDPACTYDETEKFFSARRDKTNPLQGMLAYIGIKQ